MGPPSPLTLDELRRLAPVLESITAAHGGLGPKLAMENLLSVPVDPVTRRGLRAELRQGIEGEAIPLA